MSTRAGLAADDRAFLLRDAELGSDDWPDSAKLELEGIVMPIAGRVKNGVVVLDGGSLCEGQVVRVEPVGQAAPTQFDTERADRIRCMEQLFAAWTEEDSKLTDEEADLLHDALEQS